MDIERLKELQGLTEQLYQDGNVPLAYCDDIMELIDEAIAHQTVKSEEVAEAIEYFEEILPYMAGDQSEPKYRLVITALQAYQPKPESTIEDVLRAMDWLETGDFEIIAGDEEYLANSSHHPNTSRFRKTAITALQAYQPWIPVSERLPDGDVASVLIHTNKGGVSEGQYYPCIKSWKQFRWSVENADVTHWKSLPAPLSRDTK